ncbi:MAG: hypothetical protein R3F60_03910 [bacterium]
MAPPTLDEVFLQLSGPARKLVDAIRGAGSLPLQEAVNAMGFSRGHDLTPLLGEIRAVTEATGLKFFDDTVDYRGSRVLQWAVATPPAAASAAARGPKRPIASMPPMV